MNRTIYKRPKSSGSLVQVNIYYTSSLYTARIRVAQTVGRASIENIQRLILRCITQPSNKSSLAWKMPKYDILPNPWLYHEVSSSSHNQMINLVTREWKQHAQRYISASLLSIHPSIQKLAIPCHSSLCVLLARPGSRPYDRRLSRWITGYKRSRGGEPKVRSIRPVADTLISFLVDFYK